jgi:hypothetical protein
VSGSGNELIEAVSTSARAAGAWLQRRLPECVLGLAVLVTVLAGLAFAGSLVDDRAIAAQRVFTTADVLDGSSFGRTLVRFTLPDGQSVVPERGVLYPRGLTPGMSILVEYDASDPEVVRVAGRTALDRLGALGVGLLGVWAVLGAVALWLRRRRRADQPVDVVAVPTA